MRFVDILGGAVGGGWPGSARALVATALCCVMVEQPVLAAGPVEKAGGAGKKAMPVVGTMTPDERVLHALNRLTFGPRPGDVETVKAMGLKAWFERELNPQAIDDSALNAKLAMFPAMQMPQAELMERYPSPQVLRQMIQTNAPLPTDPVEHAIYADQIAFYKKAQAKLAAAAPAGAAQTMDGGASQAGMDATTAGAVTPVKGKRPDMLGDGAAGYGKGKKQQAGGEDMAMEAGKAGLPDNTAALPGDNVDPSTPAMKEHVEQLYSGLEAVKIINLPPDERMQRILAMKPEELLRFRMSLSQAELAEAGEGLSPQQREVLASLQGSARMVGGELLQARILRDIYSDRQLEAVMTDFWLNHFNVYVKKNQQEPFFLPTYERDAIRPNALGRFEDLLVATAKSPAMLMYLDNWQSIGPDSQAAKNGGKYAAFAKNPQVKQALKDRGLNENYARELMELHTVGVQCEVSADRPVSELPKACGQGYTQKDVTAVAEVLTGWTIDRPYGVGKRGGGEYQFNERRHEPGPKVVLGKTIAAGGEREGMELLHMLATSPATAQFISQKLAVRFVSDTPPQTLVDKMAGTFVATQGDMKAVLRTMFDSPDFWVSSAYRAKVKTPIEFVASAVRASDAQVVNAQPLVGALNTLGMPLYGMQTPNGYSWVAEPWVSSSALVSRMNFSLVLAGNRLPGTRTEWPALLGQESGVRPVGMTVQGTGGQEQDPAVAAKEKKLEAILLGQPVSEKTRETVLAQLGGSAAQQQAERDFPIKIADGDPVSAATAFAGAQPKKPQDRQAAVMAGLLLGSPEFQRR